MNSSRMYESQTFVEDADPFETYNRLAALLNCSQFILVEVHSKLSCTRFIRLRLKCSFRGGGERQRHEHRRETRNEKNRGATGVSSSTAVATITWSAQRVEHTRRWWLLPGCVTRTSACKSARQLEDSARASSSTSTASWQARACRARGEQRICRGRQSCA